MGRTEVMCNFAFIALLSFVAQAHAEEVNSMDQFSDELMEKLADKLVDRVGASLLGDADLDSATLAKPGHLPLESNLPVQTAFGPEQEEDGCVFADDNSIDVVLNLQGGAAMAKSPMKSPMSSVGKAMKAKKMNEYMTKCQEAKKSGAKSFEYKGKTYVASKTKTGLVVFKGK